MDLLERILKTASMRENGSFSPGVSINDNSMKGEEMKNAFQTSLVEDFQDTNVSSVSQQVKHLNEFIALYKSVNV